MTDAITQLQDDVPESTSKSTWLLLRLYQERNVVRDQVERCLIAMSPGPIRHLPPEMVSEIFRHCLPQLCRPDTSTAPLSLCRVSSLWRDVAYATRDLWDRLDFTSQQMPDLRPFVRPAPHSWLHSPLQQWLSHSRRSQLHLSFDRSDSEILPHLVSFVLLPNAMQVFRLEILLPWGAFHGQFQEFFALPSRSMYCLKYLVLRQGLQHGNVTVFQSSPHLTHLSLDDLNFAHDYHGLGDLPILHPVFPWERLTHLTVSRWIDLEVWLSVLSSCHSLEVGLFSIDLRGKDSHDDTSLSDSDDEIDIHVCSGREFPVNLDIILSQLRDLDLILVCGQSFSPQGVHFPALKSLRLHRGHIPHTPVQQQIYRTSSEDDPFSWRNSRAFLLELKSLEILSLVGNLGSVEEIAFLLLHTPVVDLLDLNLNIDHTALFHALKMSSNPPTLLPCLNHLRFLLEPDDIISYLEDAIHSMIFSRSPSISQLSIISSSSRKIHFQNIKKLVENTGHYLKTNFDINPNSRRFIPMRRYASWRTAIS